MLMHYIAVHTELMLVAGGSLCSLCILGRHALVGATAVVSVLWVEIQPGQCD
jgi:hypothetical protein